ncbi:MAG: class I SAM-dependent methyltransferase [Planctomycetota bacterium]|jgi:SAM-dependent methyltransferase
MFGFVNHTAQKNYWAGVVKRRSPDHPAVVAFAEPKVQFVRECVKNDKSGSEVRRILDVGCGNGFFTRPLAQWANCTAFDFSERMLELNPIEVVKVCGDVLDMPFSDNSFDLVFCSNLLHHVSNPLAAVLEMKRVSSRYVALSEPNRSNPLMFGFGLIKWEERGSLKFSCNYMHHLAVSADLNMIQLKTMGSVLPNKTPMCFLNILKRLDGRFPLAFYNVMVCSKS